MLLNNSYIGGLFEKIGGFYIHRKKYLYFKFIIENKYLIIISYLKNKMNIKVKYWKNICYITDKESIKNLISFMEQFCIRDDYKILLHKIKDNGSE